MPDISSSPREFAPARVSRALLPDIGVSQAYQLAFIDLLADFLDSPLLTDEVRRRALWLKHGLQGESTAEDRRISFAA